MCEGYSSYARTRRHLPGELCSSRLLPRQAAPRLGSFGHIDPSGRQRSTYPSVPRSLSGTQTPPCCCTAGKCEAGPCTQGAHRLLEPQQVCRSAMANCREGGVKWHSNSLLPQLLFSPTSSSFICHWRPRSKRNRQRQDVSHKMK